MSEKFVSELPVRPRNVNQKLHAKNMPKICLLHNENMQKICLKSHVIMPQKAHVTV